MKSNKRNECYCKETSYEYEGDKKVMIGRIGKEKENQFKVKRIQVYQMHKQGHSLFNFFTSRFNWKNVE